MRRVAERWLSGSCYHATVKRAVSTTLRRRDFTAELVWERGSGLVQTYIAHYQSPRASQDRAKGQFEFESESRAGSKGNQRDARLKMLELYGKEAVSWTIVRVERKQAHAPAADGQLELDFRTPAPQRTRAKKKEWW